MCSNCSSKLHRSSCKVCELLDNDHTIKTTTYCAFCNAYICSSCVSNLARRTRAAVKMVT